MNPTDFTALPSPHGSCVGCDMLIEGNMNQRGESICAVADDNRFDCVAGGKNVIYKHKRRKQGRNKKADL